MKMNSAAVDDGRARVDYPHRQTSDPDVLGKYVMCLDGAWEVWLDLAEENRLSGMSDGDRGSGPRRRTRNRLPA